MPPETAFILCRFVHFVALMLLFGQSAFVAWLAPANLRARLDDDGGSLLRVAAWCGLLTAIAMVPIEAANFGNGWRDAASLSYWRAFLGTAYGQAWRWQLILSLIAVTWIHVGGRIGMRAIIAALLLASLGLLGHAAMRTDALGVAQRTNQAIHLLAAGGWLGGLLPLLRCLFYLRSDTLRVHAGDALRRFSFAGHGAVALVLLTGAANTALVLHAWPWPPLSAYTGMLDAKIVLVLCMTSIALFNRYRFVPRLSGDAHGALRALHVGTWSEIALGAAVLLLVSVFATMDPG